MQGSEIDATNVPQGAALHSQEELRAVTARYQAVVTDLASSNASLAQTNEALCQTNEELIAATEELHTANAALTALNERLNDQVKALDKANRDLRHLFDVTDVAMVFLDRDLRIRQFTPALIEIYNVRPTDYGRPLADLTSKISLPGFDDDIKLALSAAGPVERRLARQPSGVLYLVRLSANRNENQVADGVLITFAKVGALNEEESRQHVLVAELQHRSRNLLSIVQSIARRTLMQDRALDAFDARLRALGRVQSLISRHMVEQVRLDEIIDFELTAHGVDDHKNIQVAGPHVPLSRDQVQTLALVLHELATNALKHGSLRTPAGSLRIAWSVIDDAPPVLVLQWLEQGVAIDIEPSRRGYGLVLIEEAIPYHHLASTKLSFQKTGLECVIRLPLEAAVTP